MGYTELIERVQKLSPEKQSEVFDFVEFLATRHRGETTRELVCDEGNSQEDKNEGLSGPLAELRARIPRKNGTMQPMKRDELYDRSCLR